MTNLNSFTYHLPTTALYIPKSSSSSLLKLRKESTVIVPIIFYNKVGYVNKTLQPNEWYLVNNGFTPVAGGEEMPIADMIKGLTYSDEVYLAPIMQYWDGTDLKSAYYLDFTWDEEPYAEYNYPSWGNDENIAVHKTFAPGEACWLMVRGGSEETANFAGQVNALTEKEITLTTDWSFVGNPYPIPYTLFDADKIDCSGLTYSDEVYLAPVIQYWDGTDLKSAFYLDFTWDEEPYAEYNYPSWGDDENHAVHREFKPCEGYWAMVRSGTGVIKFKR